MKRCLLALLLVVVLASAGQADKILLDFEDPDGPPTLETNAAEATLVPAPSGDGQALRLIVSEGRWQSVEFPAEEPWDWTGYTGLVAEITNPGAEPVAVFIAARNRPVEGEELGPTNATGRSVGAGETITLALRFRAGEEGALWGMRGYPAINGYPTGTTWGAVIDLSRIVTFGVGFERAKAGTEVLIDNVRLWGGPGSAARDIPPFVDRYGQYALQDWPGKVKSDEDLIAQREAERATLDRAPSLPDRDEYGGWTAGPQLEATGWFRTEKVSGKWWLVTPSGHLFFSSGIDVVLPGIQTFITKREKYFEWLPDREGEFAECFGFDPNPRNHAGPLQDTGGETFDFQRANLIRKYGEDWPAKWRQVTYDRMRAWGFNTVAGWSDEQVYHNSPHPFAVCVWMSGEQRSIEGASGYWGGMPDVYDPSFELEVDRVMREAGAKFADNPRCIGYFFENELSWGGDNNFNIAAGALSSPPDQPCRREFARTLEGEYGSLAALNAAWDTSAATWEELRAPEEPNETCKEDLRAFTYAYSRKYFRQVHDAMERHTPHQLDLGCRFARSNKESIRACAEVADVVSFNIYRPRVEAERWAFTSELGKPCIIGEFHFGALDRGALHPGLVPVKDQAERAKMFGEYVDSVLQLPAFVGCHWFQYVDEPLTGRTLDGENYNIGLVTVTDTVFPELTAAARKVHEDICERRYHGAGE